MKHYYDSVLQVRSGLTIPAPGVSITVNLQGTQTAAVIYSDDGITTKLNPLATDANGRFDFYIANGRYDLIFAGTGFANFTQFNVEITDAMDTTALGKTPIAFTAANTHSGGESFTGSLNIPAGAVNPATCTQGALFYNTASNALQNCISANTWTAAGGVPGQFSVKTYGAVGDAKKSITTTLTNTLNTITDTANPFLVSDVGKFIFCIFPGDGTTRLAVGTKIATFVNAGSITVSNNATGTGAHNCVWYTQKETTAFRNATTAAISSLSSAFPPSGSTLGYNATVVCPPGGYVVDGTWFTQHVSSGPNQLGVNFQGNRSTCVLYQSPDITATNSNLHVDVVTVSNMDFGGFTLDCSLEAVSLAAAPLRFQNSQFIHVHDITIAGCGTSGDTSGKLFLNATTFSVVEQIYDNTGSVGNSEPTIGCSACGGIVFRAIFSTNPGASATFVIGGGAHSQTGGFNTIIGGTGDEGSAPGSLQVINGADVQVTGTALFMGTNVGGGTVTVDGTSTLRLEDVNLVPFGGSCAGHPGPAISIASGGIVTATNSTIQGCGASGAINGPAGATFVDIGGNDIRNCPLNGGQNPCALVTPATFATLGYTGGIVPKSTQTHTPNTCYAVTGNLLATAQNICIVLLDQNYQLLNMTAQSGGTTPANSACATPPVITLSDGTRSATMTMTSGKAAWNSGVDAVTNINQIFASGATLTVSIGANTCATPPSNVSVNYILQSVLNP